jgi:alpha-ketoglutarate-dependent taurine dioxygenase
MFTHDLLVLRMSEPATVASLSTEYRTLVTAWDAARGNPQEANQVFAALHICYKRLRDSHAGREAITGLLNDPVIAVRLSAAAHCLSWEPDLAQKVLEDIEREPTAGLYAVDAKWTLRSYRQGKLNLDWG